MNKQRLEVYEFRETEYWITHTFGVNDLGGIAESLDLDCIHVGSP